MPSLRMTEKAVERINAPATGRIEYHDTLVPGLSLRITDTGRKTWSLLYRLPGDTRKRRLTLGTYPTVKLAGKRGARDRAKDALQAIADGKDPGQDRQAQRRDAGLVETVIEDFAARHLANLKDGDKAHRMLKADVLPAWRHRRIRDITRRDILGLIEDKAESAPVGANRLLAWVRRMFGWAADRGIIEYNPALRLPKPTRETSRERVLSDDEIRAIWKDCETDGWPFGNLVQIALLTGQRRGEVGMMRWEDVQDGVWTLPATKSGRTHQVPLSKPAQAILDSLPRRSEYVFPGRRGQPFASWSSAKAKIAPKIAPWTLHDLRRTTASRLAGLGVAPHVISRVLNHAETGITGRVYIRHGWLDEKRQALDLWANKLTAILTGQPGPAEVVPMREARNS